jgi:hypothetical protein
MLKKIGKESWPFDQIKYSKKDYVNKYSIQNVGSRYVSPTWSIPDSTFQKIKGYLVFNSKANKKNSISILLLLMK